MQVKVAAGRSAYWNGHTHGEGSVLAVPDEIARRWLAEGRVTSTIRSKPVRAPRPLSPEPGKEQR